MNQELPGEIPQDAFKKIQETYLQGLSEKFKEIDRLFNQLKNQWNKEDIVALRFIIHKLAGNAGTFGFPKVSDLCHIWDQKLIAMLEQPINPTMDTAFFHDFTAFITRVKQEFHLI
ncbi:MAG: Hpt domain-containing protein [Chlamydiales bacterium]|nr:Hpt domain-containing protein [Chlamydiales bacterium]